MANRSLRETKIHVLAAPLLLVMLMCCGEPDPVRDAERVGSFEPVLDSIRTTDGFFSFSFVAPPPEGITVEAVAMGHSNLCEVIPSGFDTDVGSFWYLNVTLGDVNHDRYNVVAPDLEGAAKNLTQGEASVAAARFEDGRKTERFFATGGTVTVEQLPQTLSEWHAGEHMRLVIDADFPVDPVRQERCDGAVRVHWDEDGTAQPDEQAWETCQCRTFTGEEFQCEVTSTGGGSCCTPRTQETVALQTSVTMHQCAKMCDATSPNLYSYCGDL
ncbi:MAG: hypothetical protein ACLFVJ_18030 [Persicimonas sp.]